MKQIGKVELIINDQYLLISSKKKLRLEQVAVVFVILENKDLDKKFGIEFISLPKGEIAIVHQEKEGFYLAEVFQFSRKRKRMISVPSPFERLSAGAFDSLLKPTREEIIEEELGKWSGTLDKKASLDFNYNHSIQVGDSIGLL